jgi:hypothetical protein
MISYALNRVTLAQVSEIHKINGRVGVFIGERS